MISLWITKILLWLSHLYWWACRSGQESSTYFAELSLLWQRKTLAIQLQLLSSCLKIVRKAEAQRTDNKHTSSDDTSPLPNFKHSTKFATPQPGGGMLQRANFHNTLCCRLFCCFETPIFRAYGIGDPSSYQGAHPSLGGVSERANFHAKPCFCLSSFFWCFAMLIFTSFWEVGFLFSKKDTSISWRCPNFAKKWLCQPLGFFWLTGRRRADVVGHVGRRRADVGQTSGT